MARIALPTDPASLSQREEDVLIYVLERFASTGEWTTYRSIEGAFPHDWQANFIAVRLAEKRLLEEYNAGVRPTLRGLTRRQSLFHDLFERIDQLLRRQESR